jgi:hypothetical protein
MKSRDAFKGPVLATMMALLSLGSVQHAQGQAADAPVNETATLHPSRLAAESDLVALIQLERLDYERRRGIPVGGKAWAEILIGYKSDDDIDLLRIEEEGLGPDRCYFPEVPLWQELPRYLVFLQRADGHDFRGHRGGCMLEVLVTADSRYAVRWPQDRLLLDDDQLSLVETLDFVGPGATVDGAELTSIRREELIRDYAMEEIDDRQLRYTRGIPLEIFRRQVIGRDALSDSARRRPLRQPADRVDGPVNK